jgi:hypothetical protein
VLPQHEQAKMPLPSGALGSLRPRAIAASPCGCGSADFCGLQRIVDRSDFASESAVSFTRAARVFNLSDTLCFVKNLQTMIAILVCGEVEWFRIKKCFFTSENIEILSEGISSSNEYGYTRISHGNACR